MTNYIIRRILGFIPVLLGVTLVTFIMIRQIPGGPFDFVGDRQLPPQVVANIEAQYHLDWPLWKQFLSYLVGDDVLGEEGTSRGIIRGDFGLSLQFRSQSVNEIIKTTWPVSAQNSKTITSALRGVFRDDPKTRDEFLHLAHNGRG
jgi:oligopeptide transport system permease protein